MTKALFVCYQHGCRGEGLSYKLSQHSFFNTLKADIVNGRTILKNEFFEKKLLHSWYVDLSTLALPVTDDNIVVPSHYFYNTLKNYFPNEYYVSIDAPTDLEKFRQDLYDRFFEYKTSDLLELVGECENRIREYNQHVSTDEIKKFTAKIIKMKNVTFGSIRCMANNMDPTEENKKMLLNRYTTGILSDETKQNSLVIAYDDVKYVNAQDVVDYFNK